MRGRVWLGACLVLASCRPAADAPAEPEADPDPAPAVLVEAPPSKAASTGNAPVEPTREAMFIGVYEALRDGDWAAFEAYAGADVTVRRSNSVGEAAVEMELVTSSQTQAWLGEVRATWAPSCAEDPVDPCRGLNPLALGAYADELRLTCAPGKGSSEGSTCCRHEPMLLHNTPYLVALCFDAGGRVDYVELLDG
ncbi:hypothetical protein PPSIR1_00575 [Plesiocystis pacifica SIR-1]|uniref:Lipoprotein n=1 Tax=Plesiocystis pacifica SIR-1 TaxID=391625 RepID=A6G7H3_9BACT|nr:hypothetical protein [Plesiocystis pacifica]EDM78182.1 hypothetical protein PPSIR1_00575 [Plesiocystis pacifica SIR-1]